jgi:hypothetical protein
MRRELPGASACYQLAASSVKILAIIGRGSTGIIFDAHFLGRRNEQVGCGMRNKNKMQIHSCFCAKLKLMPWYFLSSWFADSTRHETEIDKRARCVTDRCENSAPAPHIAVNVIESHVGRQSNIGTDAARRF